MVRYHIDMGDARPVAQKQFPIPSVAKGALVEQVKNMLATNILKRKFIALAFTSFAYLKNWKIRV